MPRSNDPISDQPKQKRPPDMNSKERYKEYRERQQTKEQELNPTVLRYTKYQSRIVAAFLFSALTFMFVVYTSNIQTGTINTVVSPLAYILVFINLGLLMLFMYLENKIRDMDYMSTE